eukprot:UN15916
MSRSICDTTPKPSPTNLKMKIIAKKRNTCFQCHLLISRR